MSCRFCRRLPAGAWLRARLHTLVGAGGGLRPQPHPPALGKFDSSPLNAPLPLVCEKKSGFEVWADRLGW